jgi:hypothetical protein
MPYIVALLIGIAFHGTADSAVFVLGHIFPIALVVAVVTVIAAGFRRRSPAARRTSSASVHRPTVITPGAPVPPRRYPRRRS